MKDYFRVEVVSAKDIDKYLQKGWEIIETAKSVYEMGDTQIHYHIGYPLKAKINELTEIITTYEEYGLKEELIKRIAEQNGDDVSEIVATSNVYFGSEEVVNDTVEFMKKYELYLNDKDVHFVRWNRNHVEIDFDDIEF